LGGEKKRLRRALEVMNTREELASSAPSTLLGAIVGSMVTVAFLVLGVVRGDFRWALVAAVVSAILWVRFWHEQRS
jgi:hypothetical protein